MALIENRKAAVERLDRRLSELAQLVSVSSGEVAVPAGFRDRVSRQMALSGEADSIAARNANEPFRQYFTALRARLAATFDAAPGEAKPFADPAELARDLAEAEKALAQMQAVSIARNIVRPVRWEVEIFGFRTDEPRFAPEHDGDEPGAAELCAKLNAGSRKIAARARQCRMVALDHGRAQEADAASCRSSANLSDEARELLDLLTLIRETLDGPEPASDRHLHPVHDPACAAMCSASICSPNTAGCSPMPMRARLAACRIVPLFETIDDLRRAPDIMRELLAVPLSAARSRRMAGVRRSCSAIPTPTRMAASSARASNSTKRSAD